MKCFNIQSVDEKLGTMTAQWSLTALTMLHKTQGSLGIDFF